MISAGTISMPSPIIEVNERPSLSGSRKRGRQIYITFSGEMFHGSTKKIVEDAPKFGADEVWVYDDVWLEKIRPEYRRHNAWLFETPCGPNCSYGRYGDPTKPACVNYSAYKPLIHLDALDRCQPGDIVLYTDADAYPIASIQPLYDICARDGIMLFMEFGYSNITWCKRETFIAMGQDEMKYRTPQHGCGRFQMFQKPKQQSNSLPMQFLWEWFTYSHNKVCQLFSNSGTTGMPEYPEFGEHRCEQAILTNLAHKFGFRLHHTPSHSADPEGRYPRIFEHYDHWGSGLQYGEVRGNGSMFRNITD